jgi:hypothetical protein
MTKYETSAFKMSISHDMLKELTIKENVILQADDVHKSMEYSLCGNEHKRFYVLLEGEENSSVSEEARKIAASEEYAQNTAALALCSHSPAMYILGNLFLTVNRPKVPTKFFKKREEALVWLRLQMNG